MKQKITDLDFPPVELIDAQKKGELLIFCGAGVSMPTLPDYKGLVAEIAKQLTGVDLRHQGESKDQELKYLSALFDENKLDAAISFLESHVPKQGRAAITEYIRRRFYKQDAAPNLDRHKRLLKLACHGNALRLVTTNFDNFFELAFEALKQDAPLDTDKIDCHCYHAPLLPPVQPVRWSGIIKLHGTLHPKTADNIRDELILGSGDFGRAYLTERWASRFVTDLFRHFHVLFVGYSINDPILRYIVDAYSLDAYHDAHLKCAYLLTSGPDAEKTKTRFAGSNVKVHEYTPQDKAHSGLDNLLQGWIDGYPMSSVALKQRVTELAQQSPTEPDTVRKLVKALAHSTEAVKYFCDKETGANVSWLPYLNEAGLLIAYKGPPPERIVYSQEHEKRDFIIPLVGTRWHYARTTISESGRLFCNWLVRHIDKREFIDWLLEKGGVMHPELRTQMVWQMWSGGPEYKNQGQPTPYEGILHILTNPDLNFSDRDDIDFYNLGRAIKGIPEADKSKPIPPEIKQKILWLLNTHLRANGTSLTKAIEIYAGYLQARNLETPDEADLAKKSYGTIFELDTIKDYNQENLQEWFRNSPKQFAEIAPDLYTLLKRAFNLLRLIKESSHTYMQRPYIKLVSLMRDSLEALWGENPEKAHSLIKVMLEESCDGRKEPASPDSDIGPGHIIFARLSLHALTSDQCPLNALERITAAFPYQAHWLYSGDTQPEAADFLRSVWNELDKPWQNRIARAILAGDVRHKGRQSKERRESLQRVMLRRLKWIKGASKSPLLLRAEKMYAELIALYPGEDPFIETPANAEEISYKDFCAFTVEQDLAFIDRNYNEENIRPGWHDKNNNAQTLWKEWAQQAPQDALATLQAMAAVNRYPNIAWSGVLRKFREQKNPEPSGQPVKRKAMECVSLFEALRSVPDDMLTDDYQAKEGGFLREACDALKDLSKADGVVDFNKALFLEIWQRLMPKARSLPYEDKDDTDTYNQAINRPMGIITEALFHFMWQQSQGKYGDTSLSFQPYFESIFAKESASLILARAMLAGHLYPLSIFLPEWTEKAVLPWFDWDTNKKDAAACWNAYMYNPRLSDKLGKAIKPYLVKSFSTQERLENFERGHTRGNLVMMAAILMLEGDIDDAKTRSLIAVLEPLDKASLVQLCANKLGGITDATEKAKTWEEIKAWLLKIQKISPWGGGRPSYELLDLFFMLGTENLIKDWPAIKGMIQPIEDNDLWRFYRNFLTGQEEGNGTFATLWSNPKVALEMISLATPDQIVSHAAENLKKVLNKAKEVLITADSKPDFQRLLGVQTRCS